MSASIRIKGELSGFQACPPGVVVLQEWWGLVPHIKDVTTRFADLGYVAVAPDLFHGATTVEEKEAKHLMEGLDWERATAEIQDSVGHLQEIGCAKVGVVGFCMGGALAMLGAATAEVDAAVSFYGFPPPPHPLDKRCPPTQIFFGEVEPFFSVPDAKQWAEKQRGLGVEDTEVLVYPDAGHAFFNDTRPGAYQEFAAQDAWKRTVAHFERHLRGARTLDRPH